MNILNDNSCSWVNDLSPRTIINSLNNITGCPLIINISFNVRGEPIVNTPTDAFYSFMGTE